MNIKKISVSKSCIILLTASFVILNSCSPSEKFLLRQKNRNQLASHNIRVLLVRTKGVITVTSKSKIEIRNKITNELKYSGHGKNIKIRPEKIKNNIIIHAADNIVYINSQGYRGDFELKKQNGVIEVINRISLEEYLCSVVPGEIPALWPEETLKAQAVAARTYAMHHILNKKLKQDYDLDATTHFQVYKGISVEDDRTTEAVKMTAGEILEAGNKPIVSYFHSTCGGRTADDRFVWQKNDFRYLREVNCIYCKDSPSYSWETVLSLKEIEDCIKKIDTSVRKIKNISFKKKSGRVIKVSIKHANGTIELDGNEFRMLFPVKRLRSLYFNSAKSGRGLKITGKGWGHGVGLCQYGAKGMAEKGFNYRKILHHYYKGVSLVHISTMLRRYVAENRP